MIDLHCHLLPNIDDGARDMEQALAMARQSVADGIVHAVLTPHIHPGRWDNTRHLIAQKLAEFEAALSDAGINLTLSFAAEVRLSDEIFPLLEMEAIPFLGELDGYRLMLIEFPPTYIVPGTDKLFNWLLARNIRPVIAHPERNQEICQAPQKLRSFLHQGAMAQLTAASLLGRFGSKVEVAAERFILDGEIDVVASDAHNTSTRAPQMGAARAKVAELVGNEQADRLFEATPRQIISDS